MPITLTVIAQAFERLLHKHPIKRIAREPFFLKPPFLFCLTPSLGIDAFPAILKSEFTLLRELQETDTEQDLNDIGFDFDALPYDRPMNADERRRLRKALQLAEARLLCSESILEVAEESAQGLKRRNSAATRACEKRKEENRVPASLIRKVMQIPGSTPYSHREKTKAPTHTRSNRLSPVSSNFTSSARHVKPELQRLQRGLCFCSDQML